MIIFTLFYFQQDDDDPINNNYIKKYNFSKFIESFIQFITCRNNFRVFCNNIRE